MSHHLRSRSLWLVIAALLLACTPTAAVRAAVSHATSTGVATGIRGKTTTWSISLKTIRALPHIPHTVWRDPTNHWGFYVVMVQLTNAGKRAAVPADDLLLTMKVIPPYPTRYVSGWASQPRDIPYPQWIRAAIQQFGGSAPWTAAQPGKPITYCYVFMTARGDSHYGLYNVWLAPGETQHTAINAPNYTFLLDLGL